MISLSRVEYSYTQTRGITPKALNDISLQIDRGQFVGLIGPNGSGKSTLLKTINGLLEPSSGNISIFNLNPYSANEHWMAKRKVPILFQNPENNLISSTVEDDIAFGPENIGLPSLQIQQQVKGLLKEFELENIANREPHLLSGGQKQLVALAGLIALDPEFLLLDEPVSMLDHKGWMQLRSAIHRLRNNRNIGIIWATNNLEEVIEADRWMLISDGKIIKDDSPHEFIKDWQMMEREGLAVTEIIKLAEEISASGRDIKLSEFWDKGWVENLCN